MRRQEHRVAVEVAGNAATMSLDETVQFALVIRYGPSGGGEGRSKMPRPDFT